ncbi:MAG: hypothetical protein ACX931_06595 [Saccharospirillum sp.]
MTAVGVLAGTFVPGTGHAAQVVQVDRIRGIAEYLTRPPDPMQWVWLGVILAGMVVLVAVLTLLNKSQQAKREARRRLRRLKAQQKQTRRQSGGRSPARWRPTPSRRR